MKVSRSLSPLDDAVDAVDAVAVSDECGELDRQAALGTERHADQSEQAVVGKSGEGDLQTVSRPLVSKANSTPSGRMARIAAPTSPAGVAPSDSALSRRGARLDENDRLAVLHHRAHHGGKADRAAIEDRNRRAGGAGQRTHDAASTGLKAAAQRAD